MRVKSSFLFDWSGGCLQRASSLSRFEFSKLGTERLDLVLKAGLLLLQLAGSHLERRLLLLSQGHSLNGFLDLSSDFFKFGLELRCFESRVFVLV